METPETREEKKAIQNREFMKSQRSYNPTFHPSQQIDKNLYEDLLSRSAEFGIGGVLAEKLSTFEEGATLLDHFAGLAMSELYENLLKWRRHNDQEDIDSIADESYRVAAAMLEARKKAMHVVEKIERGFV